MEFSDATAIYAGIGTMLVIALLIYYIGVPVYQSATEEPSRAVECKFYDKSNDLDRSIMNSTSPFYNFSNLSDSAKRKLQPNNSIESDIYSIYTTVNKSFVNNHRNSSSNFPYSFILSRKGELYRCSFDDYGAGA